ncbi:hypothetical protein [Streptomyces zaehneri]|uniref:hypothetical protein n=1 Tax=Streptomyces zaehneri TaxID=3051180 RepID=UPI0028D08338|nr:hypothetical protein [Streptomyces sp. DSM 40713]
MTRAVVPTAPRGEAGRGRVARWPDPDDLLWLAEHCRCPADAPAEVEDRCQRPRSWARAAPHKSGPTD